MSDLLNSDEMSETCRCVFITVLMLYSPTLLVVRNMQWMNSSQSPLLFTAPLALLNTYDFLSDSVYLTLHRFYRVQKDLDFRK